MTIELLIRSLQLECFYRMCFTDAILIMIRQSMEICREAGDSQSALMFATLLHEINGLAAQHFSDVATCERMRTTAGGAICLN